MNKVNPNQKKPNTLILVLSLCALGVFCFFSGALCNRILLEKNLEGAVSSSEMSKFEDIYALLANKWYFSKDMEKPEEELLEKAIIGMTSLEQDPHTNYFSLEEAQAFTQALSGSNVGIGVSFYPDSAGNMAVRSVFTNSAADKAGVQPGDVIVQVGEMKPSEHTSDEMVEYIQSFDSKPVEVQVDRDGQLLTMTLTPGAYNSTVSVKEKPDYGLVEVSVFGENTGRDFSDALRRLKDDGISTLVLDLRGNTGGYLSAAMDMSASLLGKDKVVFQEKERDGTLTEHTTAGDYAQMEFDKIYVLQDGDTASASEVLIGALKDNLGDKVTTVGTTSYGKGTEQISVPFTDGTSLKYTIAEWLTPDGTSVNQTGFAPDVEVEDSGIGSVRYTIMEENEVIEPDSVHPNARPVQIYLQYLGYDTDRQDEYFSLASAEALRRFQSDHGLEATGAVDAATFDELLSAVTLQLNSTREAEDAWLQKAQSLMQENQ